MAEYALLVEDRQTMKLSTTRILAVVLALMALPAAGLAAAGHPVNYGFGLQDAVTPVQEFIVSFHYYVVWVITLITLFVLACLFM